MGDLRAIALAGVLTIVVAACGDTGPTTPPTGPDQSPAASLDDAPSAAPVTPAPSPSPTPVDAALATSQRLADAAFTATVALDAEATLAKTKTVSTGTIDIGGRASHLRRTDKTGTTTVKTETLTGNGTRYVKTKGVWTKAGVSDDTDLIAVLRALPPMTDLGVEDRDGQQLHHLQATSVPTVPSELGPPTKDVSDVATSLDAWVTEDGTPVTMTMATTWKQVVAKKTVNGTRTATFDFTDVGGDVTVSVPTDIWAFFTSKRYHYRLGHPDDWQTKAGTTKLADSFYGDDAYVYASRASQRNASLAFVNGKILGELKSITGYKSLKVTSNKQTKLDGVAARRIEFRGSFNGKTVYGQAIFAVKGAWWYFIGFDSFAKTSAATRDLFSTFIGTFDFR